MHEHSQPVQGSTNTNASDQFVCTIRMNHGIRVSVESCTTGANSKHTASHTDAFHLGLMLQLLIIFVRGSIHTNTCSFCLGRQLKRTQSDLYTLQRAPVVKARGIKNFSVICLNYERAVATPHYNLSLSYK